MTYTTSVPNDRIEVVGEVFYDRVVYVISASNEVYIPHGLRTLIDPIRHNTRSNFRKVENPDLVKKVLDYYRERGDKNGK